MTQEQKNLVLENIVEKLELPESAYEKAKRRYEDLGKWFGRDDSSLKSNKPHMFSQGSFRLGTAIKPINENEEYDLDLACNLKNGITNQSHTQFELKTMIGTELELYRKARGITSKVDEKHRCWRLDYQDELSFHMDIVPCIPVNEVQRDSIFESIQTLAFENHTTIKSSETPIHITDNRNENYKKISDDWNISNPEGFAKWFEDNMTQSSYGIALESAQVDKVPDFTYKTSLQRVIQLLKRHRDNMFKDKRMNDSKPISVIITTLATYAYTGETDLELALKNILINMDKFIKPTTPRIANPVNPDEDFADRWAMPKYKHLRLEENFKRWLYSARNDFNNISNSDNSGFITEQVEQNFSLKLSMETLVNSIGLASSIATQSKAYSLEKENTTSPWKIVD